MKKLISAVLAVALAVSFVPTAFAAHGLENFEKKNIYSGQFEDVSSYAWYGENVKAAYELGLLYGTGETSFAPDRNITVIETIVLACRLHSIYRGNRGEFIQESPWYQVYVDYAVANGLASNPYSEGAAYATRAYFAKTLANALPADALKPINDIAAIPDVSDDAAYAKAVYRLYNAGVLTGGDDLGSFKPESNIKRSEVAAIVTRMADPTLRKEFSLGEQVKEPKKSDERLVFEELVDKLEQARPYLNEGYACMSRAMKKHSIAELNAAHAEIAKAAALYKEAMTLCQTHEHLKDQTERVEMMLSVAEAFSTKSMLLEQVGIHRESYRMHLQHVWNAKSEVAAALEDFIYREETAAADTVVQGCEYIAQANEHFRKAMDTGDITHAQTGTELLVKGVDTLDAAVVECAEYERMAELGAKAQELAELIRPFAEREISRENLLAHMEEYITQLEKAQTVEAEMNEILDALRKQ